MRFRGTAMTSRRQPPLMRNLPSWQSSTTPSSGTRLCTMTRASLPFPAHTVVSVHPRSARPTSPEDLCPVPRRSSSRRARQSSTTTTFVSHTHRTRLTTVHVGKYNLAVKRRTLHGCYGSPPAGNTDRARNLLQHGLDYTAVPEFRASVPTSLHPLLDRLNGLQKNMAGRPITYSQDD